MANFSHDTIGQTVSFNGFITAESQVHTGGDEKTGNQTLLRRQKFFNPETGQIEEVPYIAGNSVRGHLRRLVMEDFLDRIGYTINDERLYHSLYAGGLLQKGDARIDVDMRRELREIPPINLFGMSFESQMLSSVLNVGHALPVCEELAPRIEDDVDGEPEVGVDALLDFTFQTRSDDDVDDTGVDADFVVEAQEDVDDEDEQAQQMKYEMEVFVPGTRFVHSFSLDSIATDADEACLHHAIRLWKQESTIGGMASAGYGDISLDYPDYDPEKADAYVEYVEENADEFCETLDEVSRK